MNKKQWKAVYDYCNDNGYDKPNDLLFELKAFGIVERDATLDDLARYPKDGSYDSMIEWLDEVLL